MSDNLSDAQTMRLIQGIDPWSWAYFSELRLATGPYKLEGHEWQVDIMQCTHPNQVFRKAAQLGATEVRIISILHKLVHRMYHGRIHTPDVVSINVITI